MYASWRLCFLKINKTPNTHKNRQLLRKGIPISCSKIQPKSSRCIPIPCKPDILPLSATTSAGALSYGQTQKRSSRRMQTWSTLGQDFASLECPQSQVYHWEQQTKSRLLALSVTGDCQYQYTGPQDSPGWKGPQEILWFSLSQERQPRGVHLSRNCPPLPNTAQQISKSAAP